MRTARDPIRAVKALFGQHVEITARRPARGGSINRSSILVLSNGKQLFLKENGPRPPALFRAEASGLQALREAGTPYAPEAYAEYHDERYQFMLLEHIAAGTANSVFWERFGRQLADMHRRCTARLFGFEEDNFIGLTPQPNPRCDRWVPFFREYRLLYQTALAKSRGLLDAHLADGIDRIAAHLENLLVEPYAPALLHGDLWSGNFMVAPDSTPVLIDPAVSYGHREADLAMTELFGGFASRFYDAYNEEYPLDPGYEERRDIYNLYHLLNHVNLFGRSYVGSVQAIVRKYSGG